MRCTSLNVERPGGCTLMRVEGLGHLLVYGGPTPISMGRLNPPIRWVTSPGSCGERGRAQVVTATDPPPYNYKNELA